MNDSLAGDLLLRIKRQRHPHIEMGEEAKVLRHHADHGEDRVIDRDRFAHDVLIAVVTPLPQTVTQDGDALGAGSVFR